MILRALVLLGAFLLFYSPVTAEDFKDAVISGNVKRVKELLEAGADVNHLGVNGLTPIFSAEDPEIVDLLLAHGAKLDVRDTAIAESPIENFAYFYYREKKHRGKWKNIVKKLHKAGAEYTINTAIYMNDIEFVKVHLQKDTSWVNSAGDAQTVPLRVAARTGRIEICKLLLKHQADPDAFEEGIGYPIMVSAIDHPEIVKLLIENKANLKRRISFMGFKSGNIIIGQEATALHFAVRDGNLKSVKLLVEAGLDPSAADDEGQTPLHIAIISEKRSSAWGHDDPLSDLKIIEYLLENDASIRFPDKSGRSPLKLAKKMKSSEKIMKALLKKQQEIRDAYDRAFEGP